MDWAVTLRQRWRRWRRPRTLGEQGEEVATRFLKRQGYLILARGDRGRLGEIDIVAVDQRTVVFVEVKTRRSHAKGHPADAVDDAKQRRLTMLALQYMKRHRLLDTARARFDIVAITWPRDRKPTIAHYRNAFEAVGQGQMFH